MTSPTETSDVAFRDKLEKQGYLPGSYRVERPDFLRKIIAQNMSDSARNVPHFALTIDINVDDLVAGRFSLREAGYSVSINDMIVKAVAIALNRVPAVNASYFPEGMVFHQSSNIAVAVSIPGGLMTPVIKDADKKTIVRIADEVREMAARAQTRKLLPNEYTGGTITISNLGMYGIKAFTSIINSPQSAILSIGAARDVLHLYEGEVRETKILTVTMSCDHRIIDGSMGAKFLGVLKSIIEAPHEIMTV